MMSQMSSWSMMSGGHGMMAALCLGFAVLVLWLVLTLLQRRQPVADDGAISLLKRRYASGEISRSDYEQALGVLNGERTSPVQSTWPL